jgi:hypothetical protein
VIRRARAGSAEALRILSLGSQAMKKLKLDIESLGVETFSIVPEHELEAEFVALPSRRSCIEQCTTSCVP